MRADLKPVPNLDDLWHDSALVPDVPIEAIPEIRAELAARYARLDTRLLMRVAQSNGQGEHSDDARLKIEEAAARLGVSKAWLYRNSNRLPFTLRIGRSLGFSARGIEKYLRQRTGR